MQAYLSAVNLFALTALLLELMGASDEDGNERLLPLFLLVISHSLALIASLGTVPLKATSIFTGLGTLWVIWALVAPVSHLPQPWRRGAWTGGLGAFCLAWAPLFPGWPVPFQIHHLLIAFSGMFFILLVIQERRGIYLAPPFILAVVSFLSLLELHSVTQFTTLLAYAFFVGAIYRRNLQSYIRREQATQSLLQEIYDLNRAEQRLFKISKMISEVPNLNHSIEHIVRSLAQSARVDQAAIFTINSRVDKQAHLLTLYSPQRPFHVSDPQATTFTLANCPPLQETIVSQQQLLLPRKRVDGLDTLYGLWNEKRSGPTLLQPLVAQGRPIGVLMLGNPVSQEPIRKNDIHLCHELAAQIALMVEHRRRYLELENEAKSMTLAAKKRAHEPDELQTAILEAISDGVVVINTKGRVQFVNHAAEHILGKPGQALIGQSLKTIYSQLDAGQPHSDLIETFAKRDQPWPTFIEEDERAIQGRLLPWRNEAGRFLGIIAIFRDVTREVRADWARNDFISALSHELRAPLTVITGYSELITNDLMGDYHPQQLQVQHLIHRNAQRIKKILDNAIKVSAQNRHRVLPRFEEIDVTRIIDHVLREIIPLVRQQELKLTREIKEDLPSIVADPRHVHRILHNLLSNACRFTPPGGRIRLQAWVQLYNWGRDTRLYLFITVADNGVGISKEEIGRVFDRFYQKKQLPPKQSGMGMGLTVVKELVELHKGKVWVESELGKGSIFRVALPTGQDY